MKRSESGVAEKPGGEGGGFGGFGKCEVVIYGMEGKIGVSGGKVNFSFFFSEEMDLNGKLNSSKMILCLWPSKGIAQATKDS